MSLQKTTLSLVLFFVSQFAFSNNYKPQPGYYLNLKGDTVHCLIDFNSGSMNPATVLVEADGSQKEFSPLDVKGFGITGSSNWVSATVTYHTNPLSGTDLPKNFSDNTETKTYILKILNTRVETGVMNGTKPYEDHYGGSEELVAVKNYFFHSTVRWESISEKARWNYLMLHRCSLRQPQMIFT